MKAMILGLFVMACTVNEPAISSKTQNFQTVCDYDADGNPIYCTGGGDSGGGGGGFPVNVCASVTQNCDPMFSFTSNLLCVSWCNDASARCQASYTCPAGTDLPVCHLGYCADWQ